MYHAGPKGPTRGKDVQIAKWGAHGYAPALLPKPSTGFTPDYGPALFEALAKVIQPREGIEPSGDIGQATWDALWPHIPKWKRREYLLWKLPSIPKPDPVPKLGPLYAGGPSPLHMDLTHRTSGFEGKEGSFWPAYDDGWIPGRSIFAVERMRVYEQSNSAGGDAFFAEGESTLRFWYGHLERAPATGRWFSKGEVVGRIANIAKDHVHLAINARPLIGSDLAHHTDYTHGASLVGVQLREALSL